MNGVQSDAETLNQQLWQLRRAVLRDGFLDAIRSMDRLELSVAQMATLMLLEAEGGSTVGDLANDLGRSLSATSRLLDQMVQRGLVRRQEDARDRRVKRVTLAEDGQQLIRQVQRRRAEAQLAVMATLSEPERAEVMRGMALLAEAANRRRATEQPGTRHPYQDETSPESLQDRTSPRAQQDETAPRSHLTRCGLPRIAAQRGPGHPRRPDRKPRHIGASQIRFFALVSLGRRASASPCPPLRSTYEISPRFMDCRCCERRSDRLRTHARYVLATIRRLTMPHATSPISSADHRAEEAPRTMTPETAPDTSDTGSDSAAIQDLGPVVQPLRALAADGLNLGGGKAVNLGILLRSDLPVPDGFAVTTAAYGLVASTDGMANVIARLADVAPSDTARLAELAGEARRLILAAPMPAEIADAVRAAYRQLGPGAGSASGARVAVRSSATAEDLPSASFAGQQDTYLNIVGEEALLDAVRRCWASLWTDRAVAYRAANTIDQGAVRLAVVVQQMVQSSAAGVLFTANPLTGQRRQMVVDASPGLGEAVVSGAVNPDHWVLDGRTGRAVETRLGDKRLVIRGVEGGGTEHVTLEDGSGSACLTDAQLRNLVALGQRVQALFGVPQDIEFAFDAAGACWLVQARPVTTLYPLPNEGRGSRVEGRGEDLRVYFSVNVAQGVFRPITPMGVQTWRLLAGSLATVFGQPPSDHYAGVATVVEAGERVFLDVTPVLRHKLGRKIFVNAMAVMEARSQALARTLTEDPHFATEGSALPLVRRIVRTAVRQGVPAKVFRALTQPAEARKRALRFAQRVVQLAEVAPSATPEQRLDTIDRAFTLGAARLWFDILPVAAVGLFARVLAGKLLGGLATSEDVERVVRALPNNPTTEMDLALWALAERLRTDAASVEAFAGRSAAELSAAYLDGTLPAALQQGLAEFLAAWGARGVAEIDLGLPRWSEDPTHILGVLANYLRLEDRGPAPDVQFTEAAATAERTITELGARAGGLKGWLVKTLLHRTRELAGLREWPKYYFVVASAKARESLKVVGASLVEQGRLESADDIFFVTLPEARAGLAGTDLRAIVAERRERYTNELGRRHVPRMLLSDGTEPTPAPAADAEELEAGALRGTPASSGVVRGTARVILDPVGAHLEPGEILVAPSTDPGWTPLFLTAAGLVMEMGGAMSHGSVVAREYGIPAVVGVDGASSKIETGQTIEVDGGRGIVRVVTE